MKHSKKVSESKEEKDYHIDSSYFAVIPNPVLYSKELSGNDVRLYAIISSLANSKGYCWASNRRLADDIDMSHPTVSRSISKMLKLGFLTVQHIYGEGTKEIIERRLFIEGGTPVKRGGTPVKRGGTPVKRGGTPVIKIKEQDKNKRLKLQEEPKSQEPCIQENTIETDEQAHQDVVDNTNEYSMFDTQVLDDHANESLKQESNRILTKLKILWPRTITAKDIDNLRKLHINKQKLLLKNAARYIALHKDWTYQPGLSKCIIDLGYTEEYLKNKEIKPVNTKTSSVNNFSGKY